MEGYIIPPEFFYWVSVCDNLRCVLILLGTVAGMAVFFSFWLYFELDAKGETIKKYVTILILVFILSVSGCIFIPSRTTLIAMQTAKIATYENLDIAKNNVKEVIDYIIDRINKEE